MKSDISVPLDVVTAVHERWPTLPEMWSATVESQLTDLCARHDVTAIKVLRGRYSFVVAASNRDRHLVIRATPDPAGPDQATAAQLLSECGAGPTVHEVAIADDCTWTVQDQVRPGTTIGEAPAGALTFNDLVRPFQALKTAPCRGTDLPRVTDWLAERLADEILTDRLPGSSVPSGPERQRAKDLLRVLDTGRELDTICHGDAHPGNLLISEHDPRVLMIDPRGMSGDIAYDLGVLALKASRYERGATEALGRQFAQRVGVDAQRVLTWAAIASIARV